MLGRVLKYFGYVKKGNYKGRKAGTLDINGYPRLILSELTITSLTARQLRLNVAKNRNGFRLDTYKNAFNKLLRNGNISFNGRVSITEKGKQLLGGKK